jgi:hypothetical protein
MLALDGIHSMRSKDACQQHSSPKDEFGMSTYLTRRLLHVQNKRRTYIGMLVAKKNCTVSQLLPEEFRTVSHMFQMREHHYVGRRLL